MPPIRSRRSAALLSIGALGACGAVSAAPAQAQLAGLPTPGTVVTQVQNTVAGLPLPGATGAQAGSVLALLPPLGTIVTQTGATLGGLVPGVGGVVTGATGSVGGIVDAIQGTVTGALDESLSGVIGGGGGALAPDVLLTLLGTLVANSSAAPGTPGVGGPAAGGPIVLAGGSIGPGGAILDASAPRPTVTVVSKLRQIAKTGKLRLKIRSNEPGIVALAANVRPGTAVRKKGAAPRKHSRKLVKIPQIVLGYRRAGTLAVTVRLSRSAQRTLGRSRNARMSVATIAVDLFRNQDSDRDKLKIKR